MQANGKNILKAFLIGSSWVSFIIFFLGFHYYIDKFNKNNCIERLLKIEPYYAYTILAPFYIGLMSALAVICNIYFKMSTTHSFLLIGFISALIVSIVIRYCDVYNFTESRYIEQYIRLQFYHFALFSIIIASIYKLIKD